MENTERKLIKGVCLETGEHIEWLEGDTPNSPTIGACQAVPEDLFDPSMLKVDEYKAHVEEHMAASAEATKKAQEEESTTVENS